MSRAAAPPVARTPPATAPARAAEAQPPPAPQRPIFGSFWMGGFESACQINARGLRIDMIAQTQHDRQARQDYQRLTQQGIHAARDGVRWHRIDRTGRARYDFTSLTPLVEAARDAGVQVVWNLCHYGWPDDLELLSPRFIPRFERYVGAVVRHIRNLTDQPLCFVPINEISYLAWAIATDCVIHPYAGCGRAIKRQLVRAAIAACETIWHIDARARIMHVDPILHVVPPRGRPDLAEAARAQHAAQWEAWDMIAGLHEPQLGGDAKYLDLVGVNYYHANQWEHPDVRLRWEDVPIDSRWRPLHRLLAEVHHRYRRPLVIAETSHFGQGRARWLASVTHQVDHALARGVPIGGLCLYPIIDRPDWNDPHHWHHAGLWDLHPHAAGETLAGEASEAPTGRKPVPPSTHHLERRLNLPYARTLEQCRSHLSPRLPSARV